MPDGVTFAREAVVNPSGDMRRPFVALAWLDQITPLPSAAPPNPIKTSSMAARELTRELSLRASRLASLNSRDGPGSPASGRGGPLNSALVPTRPRAALARRRMRPVLVFDGDHATLWIPGMDGGARDAAGRVDRAHRRCRDGRERGTRCGGDRLQRPAQ